MKKFITYFLSASMLLVSCADDFTDINPVGALSDASLQNATGVDLLLEVLPVHTHDLVEWHIPLVPRDQDHTALLERASELRAEGGGHDPLAIAKDLDQANE